MVKSNDNKSGSVPENAFEALRRDFHDDGFTAQVVARLPPRGSIMPQIVVAVFSIFGLVATCALVGLDAILGQILAFAEALSRMQFPPVLSVVAFLAVPAIMGTVGWAVFRAEG